MPRSAASPVIDGRAGATSSLTARSTRRKRPSSGSRRAQERLEAIELLLPRRRRVEVVAQARGIGAQDIVDGDGGTRRDVGRHTDHGGSATCPEHGADRPRVAQRPVHHSSLPWAREPAVPVQVGPAARQMRRERIAELAHGRSVFITTAQGLAAGGGYSQVADRARMAANARCAVPSLGGGAQAPCDREK
jgi:hypothetical protein